MKKIFLLIFVGILLCSSAMAQISRKALSLSNSMYDLWKQGKTEKAVENTLELYSLHSPLFISVLHTTLAQQLPKDSKLHGKQYLEQLMAKKNEKINKIVYPIYLYSKALSLNDKNELLKVSKQLKDLLKNGAVYESRNARYYLLILKELKQKRVIDENALVQFLKESIRKLEQYKFIEKLAITKEDKRKRAWYRYMLAYSYNTLYDLKKSKPKYLKKAADYSPDMADRENQNSYIYDAVQLTGEYKNIGYRKKYAKSLPINKYAKEQTAVMNDLVKVFSNVVLEKPTKQNIKALRKGYNDLGKEESFRDYWINFINNKGESVPKIKVKFENEVLDFTKQHNNWIYIDVWGTWCSPCKKELPDLQEFYNESQLIKDGMLKVYSFSYNSKDVKGFMAKHQYTFPVSEISKAVNDAFKVVSYPTKILITPQGKYIKIPFGVDWRMYVENYIKI